MLPLGVVETGALAFGLSMDAFAAAVGQGASRRRSRLPEVARIGLCFGLFQAVMPMLGWTLGAASAESIAAVDHWIAFALLALIGANMLRNALAPEALSEPRSLRGLGLLTLLGLGFATSIDAAVVGIGLGALGLPIVATAMVIGLVTFGLSCTGVMLGTAAGTLIGRRAELIGGIVLIAIGSKILIEHLVA